MARHAHRSHVLTLVLAGARSLLPVRGAPLVQEEGQVLLIPAGTVHGVRGRAVTAALGIPESVLPGLAGGEIRRLPDPAWGAALASLARAGDSGAEDTALAVLLERLRALPSAGGTPPPPDIARALRLMAEGAAPPVPLLARRLGLTGDGFSHRFVRLVGLPPAAWRVLLQVRRAADLLRAGEEIAAAAAGAGFYDQSHLARHFRRLMGLTPGQYRAGFRRTLPNP